MLCSITPELFAKQIKLSQFCTANGNGTMTCCYTLSDDRGTTIASDDTFLGKFCEDCTYHGDDVLICEDPYPHPKGDVNNPSNSVHPPLGEGDLEQPPQPSVRDNPGFPTSGVKDKQ